MIKKYLSVDEDGYLFNTADNLRITDSEYGSALLKNITKTKSGSFATILNDQIINLDPFDQPLVLQNLEFDKNLISQNQAIGIFNYNFSTIFNLNLLVDQWDRFYSVTKDMIPFVFSRKAQATLFNLCDSFTDDSFTISGKEFFTSPLYNESPTVGAPQFWSNKYVESNFKPGWDLGEPHPALRSITTQLKLVKSRIAVLGCGAGHDCAFFAQQGHVVTGIDFSTEALRQAQKNYPQLSINWLQMDLLKPDEKYLNSFDLIFDHTLYCAIPPSQRNMLVKAWKKLLVDRGHLLGIFFSMFKSDGPPYGGSEWELRERLSKSFDFRYWSRWRYSPPSREDLEFIIYAQKVPSYLG